MDFFLATILSALVASLAGIVNFYLAKRRRKEKAPTLEDRVNTLTESLRDFSSVISEIEAEIEKRREVAERLKGDVQRYEQLKELTQSQVEAIAQTVRGEITSESNKSIWRNALITFAIALVFFFLGFWSRGI